jgi:MFS family permease
MTQSAARQPGALASLSITLAMQSLASAAVIAPTVVAPGLLARMGLPPAAVGVYVALVYLGAMLASVLGMHVIALHGAIRTSQWALGLCALGLALVATAWLPLALAGALVLGLGYGPMTPASSHILARTTPAHRMGMVFSVKQTGVPLGGVIAGLVVPPLALGTGQSTALLVVALATALCAGPAQSLRATLDVDLSRDDRWPSGAALLRPVRVVWRAPRLRTLALCSFIFSAVQVCLTAYLVSFLTGQLHWTLVAAGAALSLSQTAGVVGRVLWGWVADNGLGARLTLIGLCGLMIACGLSMRLFGPLTPAYAVLSVLLLYGACALGWNGVYLAAVARLAGPAQAGLHVLRRGGDAAAVRAGRQLARRFRAGLRAQRRAAGAVPGRDAARVAAGGAGGPWRGAMRPTPSAWNFGLDQHGQLSQGFLPAEVAHLDGNRLRDAFLHDVDFRAAGHLGQAHRHLYFARQVGIVEFVRVADSFVGYQFEILATEGMSVACAEARKRHPEGAADLGLKVVDLAGEAVRWQPFGHGLGVEKCPVNPLRRSAEHAMQSHGTCGHGQSPFNGTVFTGRR